MISDEEIEELSKADTLTTEVFYPFIAEKLNDASGIRFIWMLIKNDCWPPVTPIERVLNGEIYEEVEQKLRQEIEEYKSLKGE